MDRILRDLRRQVKRSAATGAAQVGWLLRLWTFLCIVVGLLSLALAAVASTSFLGAVTTSATLRSLLLWGSPAAGASEFSLDFSRWSTDRAASALIIPAHQFRECNDAYDPPDPLPCVGYSTPAAFGGGAGAYTVRVVLEVPPEMSTLGMISIHADFLGLKQLGWRESLELNKLHPNEPEKLLEELHGGIHPRFVRPLARAKGSAAVRRMAEPLQLMRSLFLWGPSLLGYEVNSQYVEVTLMKDFEPPTAMANTIVGINLTLSVSQWRPDVQVYGTTFDVDVSLRGYTTYYLQRYPYLSFSIFAGVFFGSYCLFGVAALSWLGYVVATATAFGDVLSAALMPPSSKRGPRTSSGSRRSQTIRGPQPQTTYFSSPSSGALQPGASRGRGGPRSSSGPSPVVSPLLDGGIVGRQRQSSSSQPARPTPSGSGVAGPSPSRPGGAVGAVGGGGGASGRSTSLTRPTPTGQERSSRRPPGESLLQPRMPPSVGGGYGAAAPAAAEAAAAGRAGGRDPAPLLRSQSGSSYSRPSSGELIDTSPRGIPPEGGGSAAGDDEMRDE